jgi:hypothetical protein
VSLVLSKLKGSKRALQFEWDAAMAQNQAIVPVLAIQWHPAGWLAALLRFEV